MKICSSHEEQLNVCREICYTYSNSVKLDSDKDVSLLYYFIERSVVTIPSVKSYAEHVNMMIAANDGTNFTANVDIMSEEQSHF